MNYSTFVDTITLFSKEKGFRLYVFRWYNGLHALTFSRTVPEYESAIGSLYFAKFYGQTQIVRDKVYLAFNTRSACLRYEEGCRNNWDLAHVLRVIPKEQDYVGATFALSVLRHVEDRRTADYSSKSSIRKWLKYILRQSIEFEFRAFLSDVLEAQYTKTDEELAHELKEAKQTLLEHHLGEVLSANLNKDDIVSLVYKTLLAEDAECQAHGGLAIKQAMEGQVGLPSPEDSVARKPVATAAAKLSEGHNLTVRRATLLSGEGIVQSDAFSKRLYHIMRDTFIYGRPVQRSGIPEDLTASGFGQVMEGKVSQVDNALFSRLGNLVHRTVEFVAEVTGRDKDFVIDRAGLKPVMGARLNPFNEAEKAWKDLGGRKCLLLESAAAILTLDRC